MKTELEVLTEAERTLKRYGYDWCNFGFGSYAKPMQRALCLGGAIGLAMDAHDPFERHPACTRLVNILADQDGRVVPSHIELSIHSVSIRTMGLKKKEVFAALSQAISECRAETRVTEPVVVN